ncbi:hypothetical protein BN135_179 [Cronobacter muytjensii 530]
MIAQPFATGKPKNSASAFLAVSSRKRIVYTAFFLFAGHS